MVDSINCCIRDLYHLLYISRALSVAKEDNGNDKALGLYCSPSLRESLNTYLGSVDHEYAIQTAFSPSYNALLASMSAAAWRELEESEIVEKGYDRRVVNWHKGPVSQRSLEVLRRNGGVDVEFERYKVYALKWIEERGCAGLKDFLFASSDALKRKYGRE